MVLVRLNNSHSEIELESKEKALSFLSDKPGAVAVLMVPIIPGRYQLHYAQVSDKGMVVERFGKQRPLVDCL